MRSYILATEGVYMRASVLVAFTLATACGSNSHNAGTSTNTGASTSTSTSTTTPQGVILYGNPYANVNMWYGPVDFAESAYHNGCGLSDGSKYPTAIQSLYGNYLIGLDGGNIPNVFSHCDNCAQLTANGKTLIARVITYGVENGAFAIDLSPEAQIGPGPLEQQLDGHLAIQFLPHQRHSHLL